MRRFVPYLLVAAMSGLGAIGALASGQTSQPDRHGLLPTNSIPWGTVAPGWLVGSESPRGVIDDAMSRPSYFLLDPSGARYRLPISMSSSDRLLAWSQDGRYVAVLWNNPNQTPPSHSLEVRDLRNWKLISRLTWKPSSGTSGSSRDTFVASVKFFGSGHRSLLVVFSNVDLINGYDYVTKPKFTMRRVDASRARAHIVGEPLTVGLEMNPQPDGRFVATGGLVIAAVTPTGWTQRRVSRDSCTFVKWWSPRELLASCELQKDSGHTQLFAYNIDNGTRVAISPVPGTFHPGGGSAAWGYSDAFRVRHRDFVHAVPTCGPGWVESVHHGMGEPVRGTGGNVLGATNDALILEVVRGECMGTVSIVRLAATTLHRRVLFTSHRWSRTYVTWPLVLQRYGVLD